MSDDLLTKFVEEFHQAASTLCNLKTERDSVLAQVEKERQQRLTLESEVQKIRAERDQLSASNIRLRKEIRQLKESIRSRLEEIESESECEELTSDNAASSTGQPDANDSPLRNVNGTQSSSNSVVTDSPLSLRKPAQIAATSSNVGEKRQHKSLGMASNETPHDAIDLSIVNDQVTSAKRVRMDGVISAKSAIATSCNVKEQNVRRAATELFNKHPDWTTNVLIQELSLRVEKSNKQLDLSVFRELRDKGKLRRLFNHAIYRFKKKMEKQISDSLEQTVVKSAQGKDEASAKAAVLPSPSPSNLFLSHSFRTDVAKAAPSAAKSVPQVADSRCGSTATTS